MRSWTRRRRMRRKRWPCFSFSLSSRWTFFMARGKRGEGKRKVVWDFGTMVQSGKNRDRAPGGIADRKNKISFLRNGTTQIPLIYMGDPPTLDRPSVSTSDPFVSTAVSILTTHRSKSKWSYLSSSLPSTGLSPTAAAAILLAIRRRPHLALRFLSWSQPRLSAFGPHSLTVLFAAAAHVAAAGRFRRAALSILVSAIHRQVPHLLKTLAATYNQFHSAPFVFDLLVLAHLRTHRLHSAIAVTRHLQSNNISLLPSTAASLLKSVSLSDGADSCMKMYHEIFNHSKNSPDIHTFNTLLLAFYRGKAKLDSCQDMLFKEMERFGIRKNVYTCSILMAWFCEEGQVANAEEVWKEMGREGIQADVTAYNTMIGGFCGAGEVRRGDELFREMVLEGIEPSVATFERLVEGYCKVGDVDSAVLVYGDMRRRGFGIEAEVVDEVVEGLCGEARVGEGLGVLREEMKKEGFAPGRRSYEALIRGFCGNGEVEEAMRLQAEMAGKGFDAGEEVYRVFVDAYEKAGDNVMVERLRKEMASIGVNYEPD